MLSKSAVCGVKNSRFVKEQEVKRLFSNLGPKTPLNKIPLYVTFCFECIKMKL